MVVSVRVGGHAGRNFIYRIWFVLCGRMNGFLVMKKVYMALVWTLTLHLCLCWTYTVLSVYTLCLSANLCTESCWCTHFLAQKSPFGQSLGKHCQAESWEGNVRQIQHTLQAMRWRGPYAVRWTRYTVDLTHKRESGFMRQSPFTPIQTPTFTGDTEQTSLVKVCSLTHSQPSNM